MNHIYQALGNQQPELPDDQYIASIIIDEIRARADSSDLFAYADQILSENNYRNRDVDSLIEQPKDLLTYIINNPDNEPFETRFENALVDFSGVVALGLVESDAQFMAHVKKTEWNTISQIGNIYKGIVATLQHAGMIEVPEVNVGGYKRGRADTNAPSVRSAKLGRDSTRKVEVVKPKATTYEPKSETVNKPTRPLLRAKGQYVNDRSMAYQDHSTFNRLNFTSTDIKPEADFYGALTGDELDNNYSYSKVEDIVANSHAHACTLAWCSTISAESSARSTNTILDVAYTNIQLVTLYPDAAARDKAILELGDCAVLLEGKSMTIHEFHKLLVSLYETAERNELGDVLLRTLNRRATIEVNRMIRYDLAIEDQSITDFLTDWNDLVNDLIGRFNEEAVNVELTRWGRHLMTKVLRLNVPDGTTSKDYAMAGYPKELLERSIITTDYNYSTLLPVTSGALGFGLDDRVSFVDPNETPREYEYISAILARADVDSSIGTYDSISITTIDNIRFNVRPTDIRVKSSRATSTRKYLLITFVDYQ